MSYSKDEGKWYVDFDDSISSLHRIIYIHIYIVFNYKICFMSKVATLNAAVFITNSPLSKDQFSEFRPEQMLITKSFYFLYSHFHQSYYSLCIWFWMRWILWWIGLIKVSQSYGLTDTLNTHIHDSDDVVRKPK